MSPHRISPAAAARADAPAPPRWLGLAQVVWLVTASVALGILVASIPGYLQVAELGNWAGHVVEAPSGQVHMLDLAGALDLFAAALLCLALAALLYWRKPSDGMALFLSFYLLVYGITWAGPLEGLDALVPGSAALDHNFLQPGLFAWPTVALLVLFPTGRCVPSWTRWLLLLAVPLVPLLPYILLVAAQAALHPDSWLIWLVSLYTALILGAALYAQFYRYRRVSSATERQQTKWALVGLALWMVLTTVTGIPYVIVMSLPPHATLPWWVILDSIIWSLSLGILPVTLTVAVLRYRLFDIDVLIRRTLVYGTLTAILGAVYVAGVVGAQAVVHTLTGQTEQQPPFIVASTLLVVALFAPLRRRIQAVIDRRFYRRKYVAARTLAAFGATLRNEVDLAQLSAQLAAVVQQTMQPAHVSLWLRPPERPPDELDPASRGWRAPRRRTRADAAEPA